MPVVGNPYQPDTSNVIGDLLTVLSQGGATLASSQIQASKDRAYRSSAAKILGVPEADLGYFQRDELKDLVKEKMKSSYGEWKPKTKEEAIEVAAAKKGASKSFEEGLKTKVATGEPLSKEETNYFNKFLKKSMDPEIIYTDPNTAINVVSDKPQGNGMGELLRNVIGGVKASQGSGMGGVLRNALTGGSPLGGVANIIAAIKPQQGAVTQPVPTSMPATVAQPGAVAPVAEPVADPIAARIQEALKQGMDPKELARMLLEKGVDPTKYGL